MLRRFSLLVALAASVCALGSAGPAHALWYSGWCSPSSPAKTCIVSASVDGNPIAEDDPDYYAATSPIDITGEKSFDYEIAPRAYLADLGPEIGDTFSVTIRTDIVPRVVTAFADGMTTTRTPLGNGEYDVTISGRPVSVADERGLGCVYHDVTGTRCSSVSPVLPSVVFKGEISKYHLAVAYVGQPPGLGVSSFYGMDFSTNLSHTDLPLPQLLPADRKHLFQVWLADHRFEADGTTPVDGFFEVHIPKPFLRDYWGIDHPAALATDSFSVNAGRGPATVSITIDPAGTGVTVRVSGLSFFPRRLLTIRPGALTPGAPGRVGARRSGPTTARVTFTPAKTRGQAVRGLRARCDGHKFKVVGRHSPARIVGLTAGRTYHDCRLQAFSRSGLGRLSNWFSISPRIWRFPAG
jgi:hypothetical protein